MDKFVEISSIVAPLNRANVDTDAIIPKQFLKSIARAGFGPYLFDEWRYLDQGEPGMDCTNRPLNKDFILNKPGYQNSQILLSRANFGCGSSREHAPWALEDFGFRVIIAPSYADIFFNNCFKNGILPIVLSEEEVNQLFAESAEGELVLKVSLIEQLITKANGETIPFEVDPFRKNCLLEGLDDIGITLKDQALIADYEANRRVERPWLFNDIK